MAATTTLPRTEGERTVLRTKTESAENRKQWPSQPVYGAGCSEPFGAGFANWLTTRNATVLTVTPMIAA